MTVAKNPPSFYNESYLRSLMGCTGGGNRWDDNGAFYTAALCARDLANGQPIAEVGCGRGFTVRHLLNLGCVACGCEYGEAALANSVCGALFGDLTATLPWPDNHFGLVVCVGVLSHLPADFLPHALSELHRITFNLLWTNILVEPAGDQLHHLTVQSSDWWSPLFLAAGLIPANHTPTLQTHNLNHPGQWQAVWQKSPPSPLAIPTPSP